MVVRLVATMAFILAGIAGFSQKQDTTAAIVFPAPAKKKSFRPDIPGSILLELGVNLKNGITPPDFKKKLWGSRTINIYYQYPIRLWKTPFSINPGIGFSLERWNLSNGYTLAPEPNLDGTFPLINSTTLFPKGSIQRSQIVNNYLEIPLELRYDTHPEDIARSINISFGGRIGVLFDSFTKVNYTENGESRVYKDKQFHGMNEIRYGLYGRAGIGGFSFFTYFNLSPMFADGKGPISTQMNSVTMGISINGF